MKKIVLVILLIAVPAHADITTGLVGWWKFDVGTGLTAFDSSGRGNNGILTNGPVWIAGKIGDGALSFDGIDDMITLDGLSDLDFSQENAFTISAWVWPDNNTATMTIFAKGGTFGSLSCTVYYFSTYIVDPSRWQARVGDGVNNIILNSSASAVVPEEWQYMSVTWDGTMLKMYKNGALLTSGTNPDFTTLWDGDTESKKRTAIGADHDVGRNYWAGKMDEVRVYNRALSSADILELYNYTGGIDTTPPASPTGLRIME